MDARELIRPLYKPDTVRILLIGESLADDGRFFYCVDSNPKRISNIYRHTQEAFSIVFGNKCGTGKQFLQFFEKLGFYLDDLCDEPVNHMEEPERCKKRLEGIINLAPKLTKMHPLAVVVLMKKIESYVKEAMEKASIHPLLFSVPFPAYTNKNRRNYVQELSVILRKLVHEKIVNIQSNNY